MKNYIRIGFLLTFAISILIFGCKKEEEPDPEPTIENTVPIIKSITADRDTVPFSSTGSEIVTITCNAEGGDLNYEWQVDLGSIYEKTQGDWSVVEYTASNCCLGNKTITCTVSNNKGDTDDTIVIHILEP